MLKYIEEYETYDNFSCNEDNYLFVYKLCKCLYPKNPNLVRFLLRMLLNQYLENFDNNFEIVGRSKKNNVLLFDWFKSDWKEILIIDNLILRKHTKDIGFMPDDDKISYPNQFVWTFVKVKDNNSIYIKIKFINNKIKIISLREAEYSFEYTFKKYNYSLEA